MHPRLKALLVFVGVSAVGAGGVYLDVFQPRGGVTQAQLLDAGLAECLQIAVLCDAELSPQGQDVLRRGGLDAGINKRYARIGVPGFRCGSRLDGGVVLPPLFRALQDRGELNIVLDMCSMETCAANPDICSAAVFGHRLSLVVKPPTHVRAPMDGGTNCRRRERLPDGGSRIRYFGAGNVFHASEAVGTDCVPAATGFDGDQND